MPIHLDPSLGVPLYLQLVQALLDQLATGLLPEGAPVPSSRQLAAELRVNYHTVNKAYRQLEADGWLTRQRGGSWLVAEDAVGRAAAVLLGRDLERLCERARAQGLGRDDLLERVADTWQRAEREEHSA